MNQEECIGALVLVGALFLVVVLRSDGPPALDTQDVLPPLVAQ